MPNVEIRERIKNLRELMKKFGLDAYIIPSSDDHLSEYVSDYYKSREWISGFTGSAGTVVITMTKAGLWTDGRYYIQAAKQLENSGIELFKAADFGVPAYPEWLRDQIPEGGKIGLDGNIFSVANVVDLEKTFKEKGILLDTEHDLVSVLWQNRPVLPCGQIFIHDLKYAGKPRTDKFEELRAEMKKSGANHYLLTALDDIAWLLNIRGADVPNNPVAICNVLVTMDECRLFIDAHKVPFAVRSELEADKIVIRDEEALLTDLSGLTEIDALILDSEMTNIRLYNSINQSSKKILMPNITNLSKAVKNPIEIKNIIECHENDGIAMVRFIKWLKSSLQHEEITEISAAEKLESFRKQNELYTQPSFDTIAAYKKHGAMMHYQATEDTDYILERKGFFLIDSGGQYYNGTTDITRTIVLGELTEEEKRDYTLVLKGHIALSSAKFLKNTTGQSLDVLAREPIWRYGMDYKCGTGHGVGFFLNVHEGPQRISQTPNTVPLMEGMVITNEPGIYKEGDYGIRIENMMLVEKDIANEYGQFLKFKTLTWCPIDLEGVAIELLNEDEINWIDTYHEEVYKILSPLLDPDEKKWLEKETRKIKLQ